MDQPVPSALISEGVASFAVPGPMFATLPPQVARSKELFGALTLDQQQQEIFLLRLWRMGVVPDGPSYAWTVWAERADTEFARSIARVSRGVSSFLTEVSS